MTPRLLCVAACSCALLACSGGEQRPPADAAPDHPADSATRADAGIDAPTPSDADGQRDSTASMDVSPDDVAPTDAPATPDAPETPDAAPTAMSLAANRDRLLATYLEYLQSHPSATQTNGLRGGELSSVCDLWSRLDHSSRATFFTITARLQGSRLRVDGLSMLDHVARLYRAVGGAGATATSPGSCGGETNRLFMSMDRVLHASLVAANANRGARVEGAFDVADIPPDTAWRESRDAAGAHEPFTQSDETNEGAPRGQVHYFADPSSAVASMPLGRVDVMDLVDPYALEMDQDYDCVHDSNPSCEYVFYGPLCAPQARRLGIDIYTSNYGSIDSTWRPSGC